MLWKTLGKTLNSAKNTNKQTKNPHTSKSRISAYCMQRQTEMFRKSLQMGKTKRFYECGMEENEGILRRKDRGVLMQMEEQKQNKAGGADLEQV